MIFKNILKIVYMYILFCLLFTFSVKAHPNSSRDTFSTSWSQSQITKWVTPYMNGTHSKKKMLYPKSNSYSDLENIRSSVIKKLLKPRLNKAKIEELINAIHDDGSWPDINYKDVSRTGFDNGKHLSRLVTMSRAYKKTGSELQGNKQLKKAIANALNFWLKNDFIADNWYSNQIATPRNLIKILLMMDDDLTDRQKNKTLVIARRADVHYVWGARPGADRVRIAAIQANRELFKRDRAGFDQVIQLLERQIKFTNGKGVQYDYSFHHRDDRVNNTLSYGTSYAAPLAYWAATVSETKYQFSQEALQLLVDYFLDGICKMMVYGKYPDPGAKNRSITRSGALQAFTPSTPEKLLETTDYRNKEIKQVLKIRKGESKPSSSFSRFYWDSDHFTFQRPEFFTSVRMYSNRAYSMEEPYNGEGLMNHYRGDGTNYISRTGKEYDDLSPVYDWQKIPGATIMQRDHMPLPSKIQQKGLTNFVGAVTDGKYGAVGFDFQSPLDPLKAKKAWFFFDKKYVSLGTDITGDSALNVVTTLNQSKLSGDVLVKKEDKKSKLKKEVHQLQNVDWVWHDNIGYIFPRPTQVHLSNQLQTGSWYRVNHGYYSSKKEISKGVFKLWTSHGTRPEDASYQYIVVPATSKQRMEKTYENNDIMILKNTSELQAVKNTRLNIFEAVFYEPDRIRISDDLLLEMKDPGVVMVKYNKGEITSISVADPKQNLREIRLALSKKINKKGALFTSTWNRNDKMSNITIKLPQNVYKGKSVTIDF